MIDENKKQEETNDKNNQKYKKYIKKIFEEINTAILIELLKWRKKLMSFSPISIYETIFKVL